MPTKNLAAGESIELQLDRVANSAVAVSTGATVAETAANAAFALEALVAENPDAWIGPVQCKDPVGGVSVSSFTGPLKSGWVDLPSYKRVRVRRTDANVSAGSVTIEGRAG